MAKTTRTAANGVVNAMLYGLRDRLIPLGRVDLLDQVSQQAEHYFESVPPDANSPADRREQAAMRDTTLTVGTPHRISDESLQHLDREAMLARDPRLVHLRPNAGKIAARLQHSLAL